MMEHAQADSIWIAASFTGALAAFAGWWVWFIVSERRFRKSLRDEEDE